MIRAYSMSLATPKNHKLHSTWTLDRYWNLSKVSQLDIAVRRIRSWTKYDSVARILCVGFPANKITLQRRIYVVKMGHDNVLWEQTTPLYDEVVINLNEVKV